LGHRVPIWPKMPLQPRGPSPHRRAGVWLHLTAPLTRGVHSSVPHSVVPQNQPLPTCGPSRQPRCTFLYGCLVAPSAQVRLPRNNPHVARIGAESVARTTTAVIHADFLTSVHKNGSAPAPLPSAHPVPSHGAFLPREFRSRRTELSAMADLLAEEPAPPWTQSSRSYPSDFGASLGYKSGAVSPSAAKRREPSPL
jgi:hypothetical protein